jgi:two-component SAPR family response regulator
VNVLVVEDDALVALDLADMVADLGHDVVGPFTSVSAALPFCQSEHIDFAVIDFNLGRETSEKIADRLREQSILFVFLTGYRSSSLPDRFQDCCIVSKPVHSAKLQEAIETAT